MVHGSEVCGLTVILIRMECTEVQSELYVALNEEYITPSEFEDIYEQARRTRSAVRGFINYLKRYEERKI